MQERVDSKMLGSQDHTVEHNFSSENLRKECIKTENQFQKECDHAELKVHSKSKYVFWSALFPHEFVFLLIMNVCAGYRRQEGVESGGLYKFECKISFYD